MNSLFKADSPFVLHPDKVLLINKKMNEKLKRYHSIPACLVCRTQEVPNWTVKTFSGLDKSGARKQDTWTSHPGVGLFFSRVLRKQNRLFREKNWHWCLLRSTHKHRTALVLFIKNMFCFITCRHHFFFCQECDSEGWIVLQMLPGTDLF